MTHIIYAGTSATRAAQSIAAESGEDILTVDSKIDDEFILTPQGPRSPRARSVLSTRSSKGAQGDRDAMSQEMRRANNMRVVEMHVERGDDTHSRGRELGVPNQFQQQHLELRVLKGTLHGATCHAFNGAFMARQAAVDASRNHSSFFVLQLALAAPAGLTSARAAAMSVAALEEYERYRARGFDDFGNSETSQTLDGACILIG